MQPIEHGKWVDRKPVRPVLISNAANLRFQLIIPYVLLTLLMAMAGAYVMTHLVTSSARERFVNQLHEASRVAADGIVRRERTHLADLRLMVFTEGVLLALADGDAAALERLLAPLALNNIVEALTAFDRQGREIITLVGDQVISHGADLSQVALVADVLNGHVDTLGDKFEGFLPGVDGFYLWTSAPVRDQMGQLMGGLMIGTRLDSLAAELKSQSLADIVVLDLGGKLLATTLVEPDDGYRLLELAASNISDLALAPRDLPLYGRNFEAAYAPLVVRQQTAGVLGVVLPNDFVVSTQSISRSTFGLIFSLGTAAVILVGYVLAQGIAQPILQLRSMSQAVAAGDLTQSLHLRRSDEIGELATAFDAMTQRLRERTHEAAQLYAEAIQRNRELADTISQLHHTNAKVLAMQQQLIQSEKLAAIGQLTAGIVHDVKNPLSIIKALAELLRDEDSLNLNARGQIEAIHSSAARANTIVNDLLKFARPSTPELMNWDLRDTVEAALRLTAYLAREAAIDVVVDLPQAPVVIAYDAQQIEQVLLNLIQNAIQAMPQGGALRVSLRQADDAVAIVVQDTGLGIAPENVTRIFDPFFTTKSEGEGTGLGLSVSYGIVSGHGGHMDVESVIGHGTTFTVWLPVDQRR